MRGALGHYRVLDKLSEGGMGEVFRALDTRLDREVALKVLPPEAAARADALRRFLREARALASLDHPNVVAVHSVEEQDGVHFLTMGLVDGESLDSIVRAGGPAADETLDIARAIAGGLAAVHARGIVHRDLKPANVMISKDGRVKLIDFGLVKLSESPHRSVELTGQGVAVGTIPYMSPEQLRGAEVDVRTDVFSFGVLLHELVAGRRPFQGGSGAEVISAILNDPPAPLTGDCCERYPRLPDLVSRCLEKDPDDRYPGFGELLEDLESLDEAGSSPPVGSAGSAEPASEVRRPLPARPSLAVLPFENLSGDPDQDPLALGLWHDLNAELVKLAGLFLLNGTSTITYRGRAVDVQEVGRELGVRHVLQGTVRRGGERVRLTVQLTDTVSGSPVWAERYDAEGEDLLDSLDDVYTRILEALDVQLLYGEFSRTMREMWKSPRARDLFYRAVPLSFSSSPGDLEQARRLLEAAEQEEPGKCVTYDHIGWSHYFDTRARWTSDPVPSLELAEAYASKAVEMDDPSGLGHMLLAAVHLGRGKPDRALEVGWEAMDRRPGCPWAYAILGNVCNYVGRPHQALELVERAARLSPLVPSLFPAVTTTSLYVLGHHEEAAAAARGALELDAESVDVATMLAAALAAAGRRQEAADVAQQLRRDVPQFSLDAYAARQPYSDPAVLDGLLADLRAAGL